MPIRMEAQCIVQFSILFWFVISFLFSSLHVLLSLLHYRLLFQFASFTIVSRIGYSVQSWFVDFDFQLCPLGLEFVGWNVFLTSKQLTIVSVRYVNVCYFVWQKIRYFIGVVCSNVSKFVAVELRTFLFNWNISNWKLYMFGIEFGVVWLGCQKQQTIGEMGN